jgi:hypothetical protein
MCVFKSCCLRKFYASEIFNRQSPHLEANVTVTVTIFHVAGTAESELPAKQSGGEEAQETAEGVATPATVETQDAPRENRLSSLLSGRRRANAVRRPGTLLPSTTKQSGQD